MSARWNRFAAAQRPDEIARQHDLLASIEPTRLSLTVLVYGLNMMFLPPWLCALLAATDTMAEWYGLRWLHGLNPAANPRRYLAALFSVAVAEISFAVPAALIWQQDSQFAKAFAVGTVCMTLLQLLTVRAIHLPGAMVGWFTVGLTMIVGNSYYWLHQSDVAGFALSSGCITAAALFTRTALVSINGLHDQMARDRSAALAADQAKSRFLAQMSHELRTPLNAILGMGHAELAQSTDPRTKKHLGILVDSAASLAVILDDILDMSAIAEGALPIRLAPADPKVEIAASAATYRSICAAAGLSMRLELAANLPAHAMLDAQRLRQCLSNLLSNALKHTRIGGVVIEASLSTPTELQVIVTDTGRGIDQKDEGGLFQPFHRGMGPETGTGLGLAISRALARQMGGDLVLLPSAVGARFCLTIALTALSGQTPAPLHAPVMPDLRGRRILVVDDVPTNRLVAATLLRLFGASIAEAASGQAALDYLRDHPVDLVLLDMNMPGLNGIETLNAIRAMSGAIAVVPVLAMTANATSAQRQHYIDSGLDGYVSKPLSPASLAVAMAPHLA